MKNCLIQFIKVIYWNRSLTASDMALTGSKTIAPRFIIPATIDPLIITPRIVNPLDNCPQENLPPDNFPQDNCHPENCFQQNCNPENWRLDNCPPDNYPPNNCLPRQLLPVKYPRQFFQAKYFIHFGQIWANIIFYMRTFLSCIYLILIIVYDNVTYYF